jgi:hypothetical protein
MHILVKHIKKLLSYIGLEVSRKAKIEEFPIELTADEQNLVKYIYDKKFTMTSKNNLFATALSCKYIIENKIWGDFVECGTYRGGHALLAAALFRLHKSPRNVYIYDTFEGMTLPDAIDIDFKSNTPALEFYHQNKRSKDKSWCAASLEEVKDNFVNMNLNDDNIKFIKGDVNLTLRDEVNLPNNIALLRLDTDWYSSTKTEIESLYPLLTRNGILIIDDYGWWKGSKLAIDEYFKHKLPYMSYIDQGARLVVKT